MAPRVGLVGYLLVVGTIAASCSAQLCLLCQCSSSTEKVSCNHMGMNLVAVPPGIPPDTITLDLSGHAITTIEYDDFRNLTKLKTLLLGSNKINSVAPGAFSDLTSLTTLDLHGNDISAVTTDTFAGLTAVQDLYLGSNNLTRVPRGALRPLTNLISLTLTGNPLHCDCGVAWIVTFTPVETEDVACSSPPLLADHKLSQLTPDQLGCVVPSVVAASYQMSAYVDQSVLMSCTVEGAPAEDLVWLFEGVGIEEGGENVKVLSNGSLYIVGMKMELAGDYMCVSSNMAGTNSATISLLFLGVLLPQISVRPSHTHAFPGENVLLRCQGDQYTISYYWLHSGQLLVSSSHAQVVMETGLNITNVTREDSGVYTCVAVGNAGSVNASAILTVTGPLLSCEGVIDASTMDAIRSKVNFAFNHMDLQPVSSPHQLLRRLNLPDNGSIELLVAGDVFQEALEVVRASHTGPSEAGVLSLSECEVTLLAELSGCLQHGPTPDCSDTCYHTRYRSVDGSCNNWGQPRLGMTDSPFLRLLAPAYEDGLGRPVGWSGGLPSARAVSQSVIRAHSVESDADFTHMIMQIGQFLDHDIDLASGTPSDVAFSTGAMCDSHCDNSAPCFPIPVPDDDPRLTGECLPFTRSGGVCGTGPSSLVVGATPIWREQINAISSFMDGSQIYGSTSELAERLRDPQRRGWLLEGDVSPGGKPFLPFDEHSLILCDTGIHANRSACFLAGDVRVNEQVGLTVMHTLFFREHNRVASSLSYLNAHWDQERLFQESRKIVVAEWQHIVFTEYLPKILGPSGMSILGDYHGYDPNVNPTIANAFATAAYRFGHSQIQPVFERLGAGYLPHASGPLLLRDAFFAPFRLLEEGGVDPLLRGLLASGAKKRSPSSGLNSNLTEALFAQVHEVALDLAALNIQRGRDHGLPSYLAWREFCGLETTDPLADIGNDTVKQLLMELYEDMGDIDLWVGGLLETLEEGAQLGPTFNCLIAGQFARLRDGDRFWYERVGQFSPDQLLQLKQASLSRIICDNADSISRVPRDALLLQEVSEFTNCSDLPSVNLDLWMDCQAESGPRDRRSVLLEAVAEEVMQLRAAVTHLQNNAASCVVNGVTYGSGATWTMGLCSHCSCQMGQVSCFDRNC